MTTPPAELSAEELGRLSKQERTAYFNARRAAGLLGKGTAREEQAQPKQLTKAERRQMQEAQRKAKDEKKEASVDNEELLKELKLQGLSEDQAKEVAAEMLRTDQEAAQEEEEDDEAPEDLLSSVRKWMSEQDEVPRDALHEFNMKVRFQGHVDSTPPDHIAAVLEVLMQEACSGCDLAAPKLQPTDVAKKAEPLVARWAPLLEPLYGKISDPVEAADIVLRSVQEGVAARGEVPKTGLACGVVGFLMALREIDMIEDEDLLTGCKRSEPRSKVMDKFIEFLEDELEDEDEEGDD